MRDPIVELSISLGTGERYNYALRIDERLYRELRQTVELSDDPFSLLMASPGVFGGKGDAVNIRNKVFKMREGFAKHLSEIITSELINHFGMHDEKDGYRKPGQSATSRNAAEIK